MRYRAILQRWVQLVSESRYVDGKYYEVAKPGSLGERLVTAARDRIYADFLRLMSPRPTDTLLDVGVSDVVGAGANLMERLYPYSDRITAAGLGEGQDFRATFPQIDYVQVVGNQALPFGDQSFDIACANAVLEHVGSPENQRGFIRELVRVAKRVFLTVPHRYFPVEHHTAIPFLHYSDAGFRFACRMLGKSSWAEPENLILMSTSSLASLCPPTGARKIGYTGIPLGPFSSNLFLVLDSTGASRA